MSKALVRPPFKNTYVYFDAFDTDVRIPRLDMIQGDYVKITLKQITFRYTYTLATNNVVVAGDIYVSPVSSVAMFSNGGIASQSLHYFMDRPTAASQMFPSAFRSSALEEWGVILQKSLLSGQNVQLKHNIVSLVGIVPAISALACVLEITDASE